jgi:hypothetical protein
MLQMMVAVMMKAGHLLARIHRLVKGNGLRHYLSIDIASIEILDFFTR